jgi:hypothetical protein
MVAIGLLAACFAGGRPNSEEPWFEVRTRTHAPDPKAVKGMRAAVSVSLHKALRQSHSNEAPVHYWFQYGWESDGPGEVMFFVGFPFPVPADPAEMRVWVPEVCSISGRYEAKSGLYDFHIGGFNCPPRI